MFDNAPNRKSSVLGWVLAFAATPLLLQASLGWGATPEATKAPSSSDASALRSKSATTSPAQIPPKGTADTPEAAEMRAIISTLNRRISELEKKIADLERKGGSPKTPPTSPVRGHPSDQLGTAVDFSKVESPPLPVDDVPNPEAAAALVSKPMDQSINAFQNAFIRYRSKQFADAILGFSKFVEIYPDHPLAGSAQYYVANSYLQQKEYKLAAQEYARLFTTFDRSPHVSDALREIALCEDQIKNSESASRHRQLLTSLFAPSPAASQTKAPEREPVETDSEEGPKAGSAPASTSWLDRENAPQALSSDDSPSIPNSSPASHEEQTIPTAPLVANSPALPPLMEGMR